MAIPLVIAVAGTAISAWNKYQAGQAEAGAFRQAAQNKIDQADSIMERFGINAEFTRMEGKTFQGKQRGAISQSGVDIGSGFALSSLEDTAIKIERRIEIDRMEAETNRDAILLDADLDQVRADNASSGGTLGAVGAIFDGFMGSS